MGGFLLLSLVTKNPLKCTFQRPLNYTFYHGGPHPARRDSVWNRIWSFLSLHCMLLGYSFKPRPNILAVDTVGSVVNIGLSIGRCLHSKTQFDEGIQNWLVQKFGLYPASRGPSIFLDKPDLFRTYLGRSKGPCSQGIQAVATSKDWRDSGRFSSSALQSGRTQKEALLAGL